MPALADVNGTITPIEEAQISALDRGFLFGDAVYEVIRVYAGRPFRLDPHLQRMMRSCDGLALTGLPPMEDLAARGTALAMQSGLQDAILYYQVSRGVGSSRSVGPAPGAPPTVVILCEDAPAPTAEKYETGVRTITARERRWQRSDLKTVNLIPRTLVRREAQEAGVYEAIWIDDEQRVLEGSASNVFAVVDGILVTPPLGASLLAGVTREDVLKLAVELGIPFEERDLSLAELLRASEAMVTGTVTEVLPVIQVDQTPIGDGRPGPTTRRLISAYRALIGV